MHNTGCIVAVEASELRFERMRNFLADSGACIVDCVHADGTQWKCSARAHTFDRVLVDAPCSSSGLWPRLDWKRVTREGVRKLADKQFALLSTVVREVKVGGTVVYSVCSYLPQETVDICKRALQELPLELDKGHGDTSELIGNIRNIAEECDAMGFFVVRFRRLPGGAATRSGCGKRRRRMQQSAG